MVLTMLVQVSTIVLDCIEENEFSENAQKREAPRKVNVFLRLHDMSADPLRINHNGGKEPVVNFTTIFELQNVLFKNEKKTRLKSIKLTEHCSRLSSIPPAY